MKNKILSLSLFSLLLVAASCSKQKETALSEHPAVVVTTQEISGSQQGHYVTASGKVEAENSANLSTRMMGYVTAVKVKTGQKVSQGQLLATISNTDLQAKKAQAEAGVAQATAGYNSAKRDFDRFATLFAQKSVSQKEMDDMTTHLEMAKAGLEGAKQMKNEVMAQFSYANITAPFAGVVTGTYMKEGDMANPGMPIVSVEGASKLQVVVMVSESDISNIKQGMKTEVRVKSLNKTFSGKVIETSSSARNTGGQYIVKVELDKADASVLSGMFVNVVFPIENRSDKEDANLVLIPLDAVISQGQLKGIYVVGDDNTAMLRWIRLGKTYGDNIQVLSGLSAGEKYVVTAEGRLFNGSKVSLK